MATPSLGSLSDLNGAAHPLFPAESRPMQPTLIPKPFSDPDWIFEPKLDGFRGIAVVKGDAKLISRKGFDLTPSFGEIAQDLKRLDTEAIFDGEIVALAPDGRPCFDCLQQRIGMKVEGARRHLPSSYAVTYYVFDVLHLDGYDLTGVQLGERKKILAEVVEKNALLNPVDHFETDGELVFAKAIERGFEGVVAKRKDSIYEPAKRVRTWLKAKASLTGQFLIGGYVESPRTQSLQGIIVGKLEGKRLKYKGSVGTGMGRQLRADLLAGLAALKAGNSPFEEELELEGTPVWIRPEIGDRSQIHAVDTLRLHEGTSLCQADRVTIWAHPSPPSEPEAEYRPRGNQLLAGQKWPAGSIGPPHKAQMGRPAAHTFSACLPNRFSWASVTEHFNAAESSLFSPTGWTTHSRVALSLS